MTKLFPKLLSLTLALLMLAGCASTPAKDPLEGTITIEPFDAEKLGAESGGSAYAASTHHAVLLEDYFYGTEYRMLDHAVFGTVLDIQLATAERPEKKHEYMPSCDLMYIRYQVRIDEVVYDKGNMLKPGITITLYHNYCTKDGDLQTLKKGTAYALTFMEGHEYQFFYNKSNLPKYSYRWQERKNEEMGVEVIWKIPMKQIGDYFMECPDYRAYEIAGDKMIVRWPKRIADRYLFNTEYENELKDTAAATYYLDKDFFAVFHGKAMEDLALWQSEEQWSFEKFYLFKYDKAKYEAYVERLKSYEDQLNGKFPIERW